ncbi:hypothetical protein [Kitasatospora sp. NPDC056531]|uniref:hypothetical protein n=1 Tax=Kitasatospora sp. NPDC056531 TaxID=3345856 RepID=UPI0036B72034
MGLNPHQGARLRAARREAHQLRQGGEAGREDQVALEDEPPTQLLPRIRVVPAFQPRQERRDAIDIETAVTYACPVHHPGIEHRTPDIQAEALPVGGWHGDPHHDVTGRRLLMSPHIRTSVTPTTPPPPHATADKGQ